MGYIEAGLVSEESVAERKHIYRLLARFWICEVDRNLILELSQTPLKESFVAAGVMLPADADKATIEQLAIDYCQLFLGPKDHFPPCQSVWQTGQFQSEVVTSVRNFIEISNYPEQYVPDGVMLDHLGVQLDVMGHLLDHIDMSPDDTDGASQIWELIHSFYAAHLMWPSDLFDAVIKRAETDFYRSFVVMTQTFLNSEQRL